MSDSMHVCMKRKQRKKKSPSAGPQTSKGFFKTYVTCRFGSTPCTLSYTLCNLGCAHARPIKFCSTPCLFTPCIVLFH